MKNYKQVIMLVLPLIFFLLSGCFESSSDSGGTGDTPSVPDGSEDIVNIENSASRTDGVAPLSVFFNADLATSTTTTRTFHDYQYEWDFDDPGAGIWAVSGLSQNTDTGPCAAHVFETPGNYNVSLTVWKKNLSDNTNSIVYIRTFNITVEVPDIVFADANTTCITSVAESDFTDCPAGATQVVTDNIAEISAYTNAGQRVLLDRGASWSLTTKIPFPQNNGPVHIGAYGVCAGIDDYGICTNAPSITTDTSSSGDAGFLDLRYKRDWRITDLAFTGSLTDQGIFGGVGDMRHILIQRIDSTGFNTPVGWSHWRKSDNETIDAISVVSCRIRESYGMTFYVGSERLAILGNEIKNSQSTHATRLWWAFKGVYSHNDVSGASYSLPRGRHALKLHGPDTAHIGDFATIGERGLPSYTRFVVVSNNTFGGSGPWPIAIAPEDSISNERMSDIIFEKNKYAQEYGDSHPDSPVSTAIYLAARYSTVRNNILDVTGGGCGITGINITRRGLEPTPQGNEVYNNTVYRGNDGATTNCTSYGIKVHTDATETIIKNNLVSYEYISTTPILINDESGNAVFSSNLLTDSTAFVDPENLTPPNRDFSLTGVGGTIDTGESVPVFDDFDEIPRAGDFDLGAYSD